MSERNITYNEEHEQFVSGHSGTSALEIALVVSTAPLTLLLREMILFKISYKASSKQWVRFAVDFSVLVMTLVCGFTVFADQTSVLITAYLMSFVTFLLQHFFVSFHSVSSKSWTELMTLQLPTRLPFITHFRAYVNLATAICILAVDFIVFPRRFCKAETYGTGIMDVGVGAYVVANAIVSPEAKGSSSARCFSEVIKRLGQSVLSSIPLWVLAFCRLLAVKGIDYHEHVSEYGVHWNFFFTLAVVRVMSTLVFCFVSHQAAWLLALIVAGLYETWLQLGLKDYLILGADGIGGRTANLLDANREGVFSSFGYLAVYFAGVQLGQYLLKSRSCVRSWISSLLTLLVVDGTLWVLLAITQATIDPVSRRMANLSYVIWMMAYNVQLLAEFLMVDLVKFFCIEFGLFGVKRPPTGGKEPGPTAFHLLEAISRNGLFYFLLANVLTGVVNLLVATIDSSVAMAIIIITSYMLVLSVATALLHFYNITIKFW